MKARFNVFLADFFAHFEDNSHVILFSISCVFLEYYSALFSCIIIAIVSKICVHYVSFAIPINDRWSKWPKIGPKWPKWDERSPRWTDTNAATCMPIFKVVQTPLP